MHRDPHPCRRPWMQPCCAARRRGRHDTSSARCSQHKRCLPSQGITASALLLQVNGTPVHMHTCIHTHMPHASQWLACMSRPPHGVVLPLGVLFHLCACRVCIPTWHVAPMPAQIFGLPESTLHEMSAERPATFHFTPAEHASVHLVGPTS